ncbi:MAG: hypothetical protein KDA41_07145 [Planctomycetales bacterium]|nr:hypothetical protein [Planctomycetales bacterium]
MPHRTHPRFAAAALLGLAIALLGCRLGVLGRRAPAPVGGLGNPLFVAAADAEFVYDQAVDAVDDYFKIQAERRMKLVGGYVTPGRIDTYPVIGATLLEPWRADFQLGAETTHNTLQTIRRFAIVELLPADGGYLISVNVMKEIEDVSHPENSTVGSATMRHDGTLVRTEQQNAEGPITLGWIPLGRDVTLEQRILADIQARVAGAGL